MSKPSERGHSIIEVALMAPWIFFIFMAVIDIGFYCYAAINAQNAARAAALYSASMGGVALDPLGLACSYAIQEVRNVPVTGGLPTGCAAGSKVQLTLAFRTSATTPPSPDGRQAVAATVTIETLPMIPVPGLMSQLTISRTAVVRVNGGA
jgi:Flp pilus assembly protein TadG